MASPSAYSVLTASRWRASSLMHRPPRPAASSSRRFRLREPRSTSMRGIAMAAAAVCWHARARLATHPLQRSHMGAQRTRERARSVQQDIRAGAGRCSLPRAPAARATRRHQLLQPARGARRHAPFAVPVSAAREIAPRRLRVLAPWVMHRPPRRPHHVPRRRPLARQRAAALGYCVRAGRLNPLHARRTAVHALVCRQIALPASLGSISSKGSAVVLFLGARRARSSVPAQTV